MKDEDILRGLRNAAREEERAYEAWRSSKHGQAWQVPRTPLVDGIVARALEAVGAKDREDAPANPPYSARALSVGRRRAGAAFVMLAILAATAFFFHVPAESPLPEYSVAFVSGTEARIRSEPPGAGHAVVRSSTPFELVVRPATRSEVRVAVRAWLVSGARRVPISVETNVNAAGVARVHGVWPGRDSFVDGSELVLVVARPGDLPQDDGLEVFPSKTRRVLRVALDTVGD